MQEVRRASVLGRPKSEINELAANTRAAIKEANKPE